MRLRSLCALFGLLAFVMGSPAERPRAASPEANELLLYVSAAEGSDSWSGRLAAPNAEMSDGPLASFEAAQSAIRAIDRTGLRRIVVLFRDGSRSLAGAERAAGEQRGLIVGAAFPSSVERSRDFVADADAPAQPRSFHDGVYRLPATITLNPQDSGSPQTEIVYQNYPGEHPIFSGGMRVQNWTNAGGNRWVASLSPTTAYFENLFYNGERRLRPRLNGYLGPFNRIASVPNVTPTDSTWSNDDCSVYTDQSTGKSTYKCFDRFGYITSAANSQWQPMVLDPAGWGNLFLAKNNLCDPSHSYPDENLQGDIEALVFEQFSTSKLRVSCVDFANKIVYMTGPTPMPGASHAQEAGFIQGNRIVFENVKGALSEPGQWFLDHPKNQTWTLTYLARSGENPNFDEVIVPQLPQLLVGMNVQHVTLRGLTFEYDNYVIPFLGHPSSELEADISSAVSFQNSNYITVDGIVVRHTAGGGLDFDTCFPGMETPTVPISPTWCLARAPSPAPSSYPTSAYSRIENSVFYDLGVHGIRIGQNGTNSLGALFNDTTSAHDFVVQNNLVAGFGRVIPAGFGIGQGVGYHNYYAHNEVHDGYHTAISISHGGDDNVAANGQGNANNTITYNRVYDLFQGIMSDGGSLRIEAGNNKGTSTGNAITYNVVHDTSDASIIDNKSLVPNLTKQGYGGNGIYLDNSTGGVDVEFNLVYRVSDTAVYTPHGPVANGFPITVKNNILAYARKAMIGVNDPYQTQSAPWNPTHVFDVANNIFYFDRDAPDFLIDNNCTFPGNTNATPSLLRSFSAYESFSANLYWSTIYKERFATAASGFAVMDVSTALSVKGDPCGPAGNNLSPGLYTMGQWMANFSEDAGSVARDPGFVRPNYPDDDYRLRYGSPLGGFVPFNPDEAGRYSAFFGPPPTPPSFVTMPYDPRTDF